MSKQRKHSGSVLRKGVIATVAAALVMSNVAAFAAEEPNGGFFENSFISGEITAVGNDTVTVKVSGAMQDFAFENETPEGGMQFGYGMGFEMIGGNLNAGLPQGHGMGQPPQDMQNGELPPELPDGENMPEGMTPPERPDGENMPESMTPPERPDGENMPEGMTPPERPDGENMPERGPQGQMPFGGGMNAGFGEREVTLTIDENTVITKGSDYEVISFDELEAGDQVVITMNGSAAAVIAVV